MSHAFDPYEQWLGIPPGPRPPDHYRLLGVATFEANGRHLYEQTMQRMSQVRKYQMGPQGEHALRLQQEISRAFDVLSDPARKAAYDSQLRAATNAAVASVHGRPPALPADVEPRSAAVVETASAAEIETVVAEPEPPPLHRPVMRPSPPAAVTRRTPRRREAVDAPLLLLRYLPWLGGGVIVVAAVIFFIQVAGGKGTLQVEFSGLTPQAVVRLDGEPVDPQRLAKGQSVSMGMHKLEVSGPDIESAVREFAVHRGQATDFQVALTPLPKSPAAMPSPAAANPPAPKPISPPPPPFSTSPSTTVPLLGSTWVGDDVYPNTSFSFEAGGVLSWSHERGGYRTGTWRQTGNSLYFEQNNKYREFHGTLAADRIAGDSTNVEGKRWTLTLRRATLTPPQLANVTPPSSLLEGTTWSGQDNNDPKTFRFERGGVLSYTSGGKDFRNGTWKQTGNSIYFEMNKQYREFRGVLNGNLIEGDSWNVQGLKWKTSIRRQ